MTLEIQEVYLLQKALEAATIKAVDAPVVLGTMNKLKAEFERLQAKQAKEQSKAAEAKA